MAKKMLIDATHAEETRVVVVDGNKVEEFDFESENKRQLAGNIYLAKVTRVEPSLQAAFVDYGGNRHGFLAFSEIHPDYYQIPVADREALLAEEQAYAEAMAAEDEKPKARRSRSRRSRSKSRAEESKSNDAVATKELDAAPPAGMDVIDLDEGGADPAEGHSPMDLVEETPPVADPDEVKAETSVDTASDAAAEAAAETDAPAAPPEGGDAAAEAEAPAEAAKADDAAGEGKANEKAETAGETGSDEASDDEDDDEDDKPPLDATEKDDQIESVAEEDVAEEIRTRRKPRPKKYKIQEVIKVRQILLVQVVKEERGNKGAALTTYLSLAGRYCVLMPNTARGGGISRKITNATDRKKLKDIAAEIDVPKGAGGLIIRTAGAKRTKSEIKRDYEYLFRLWEQIRQLTLESIAPAKIYEEGNLIKRSIRDLYNREIDEVLVEGEVGYRTAKDFMKMIMPSHAKNVKNYQEGMPLFARYQVESYLSGMFNPTVQLKSGGYIVIGVTEALVAIDVNSGRATKEGSIEETALKTNLEAAEEVARQLRLRDLAGLIVIDFIDMEERKNNNAVEKRMKDKLKTDRARIQVGRISGFGLMEMSRQRLRPPGMIEATTQPCNHCHGTGLIRSDDNLALNILRQLEEEGVRRRSREVLLKAPIGIINFLMNNKREHIAQIEARYGLSVRIEADPFLISPDFSIEKFKTATRIVAEAPPVVSVDASLMNDIDAEVEEAEVVSVEEEGGEEAPKPKKRRRRRRRRKSGGGAEGGDAQASDEGNAEDGADEAQGEAAAADAPPAEVAPPAEDAAEAAPEAEEKPKRRRTRRKKADEKSDDAVETSGGDDAEVTAEENAEAPPAEEEKPKKRTRKRTTKAKKADEAEAKEEAPPAAGAEADAETPAEGEKPKRKPPRTRRKKAEPKEEAPPAAEAAAEEAPPVEAVVAEETPAVAEDAPAEAEAAPEAPGEAPPAEQIVVTEATPEPAVAEAEAPPAAESNEPPKPKKKGWWSLGGR